MCFQKTFSVVYGLKETYFDVLDKLSIFWEDICRTLPCFHALTRSKTTSSFCQLGKAKLWKTWMKQHSNKNESLTRIFTRQLTNNIDVIGKYIYNCYSLDTCPVSSPVSDQSPAFVLVVKYSKHLSLNTFVFSSFNWITWNTCLNPSWISLEAVSAETGYTWSNILRLESVWKQYQPFPTCLYGKIVLRLVSILYWKLVLALKYHLATVIGKKWNELYGECGVWRSKCKESKWKNRLCSQN